jgi:2,3-bisphosphoglycerate-independent phosphoglycerate mutase
VQVVDLCLARLLPVIRKLEGALMVTADHGNADEMFEFDKKSGTFKTNAAGQRAAKTSHTLNPVPCHVYAPVLEGVNGLRMADVHAAGLASVAATSLFLLGLERPEGFEPSLLTIA